MDRIMRAARLHQPGQPLSVDEVPVPQPRRHDALIRVRACGVIPNMNRIFSGISYHDLPPLPAIVGLDAAGEVVSVGDDVFDLVPGERVYVNPLRTCGTCHYCRNGYTTICAYAAFQGYFAFSPQAVRMLENYPYGGFAQYMLAPARDLVRLPAQVSFEHGARFGYLGTAYAALQRTGVGPGSALIINGVTGTLGVAATLWALGLGVTRILGLGRNREVLAKIQSLSPGRIQVLALGDEPIEPWVRSHTAGVGADGLLDCTGRGSAMAPSEAAIESLREGGIAVNVSALLDPLPIKPAKFMDTQLQYRGSNWFSVAQGHQMAELVRAGVVDLAPIKPQVFPLAEVNEALAAVKERPGGFVNIVVAPDR
jgi:alcohol dehydrogenase